MEETETTFENVAKDCPWRHQDLCNAHNLNPCTEEGCAVVFWIQRTERMRKVLESR